MSGCWPPWLLLGSLSGSNCPPGCRPPQRCFLAAGGGAAMSEVNLKKSQLGPPPVIENLPVGGEGGRECAWVGGMAERRSMMPAVMCNPEAEAGCALHVITQQPGVRVGPEHNISSPHDQNSRPLFGPGRFTCRFCNRGALKRRQAGGQLLHTCSTCAHPLAKLSVQPGTSDAAAPHRQTQANRQMQLALCKPARMSPHQPSPPWLALHRSSSHSTLHLHRKSSSLPSPVAAAALQSQTLSRRRCCRGRRRPGLRPLRWQVQTLLLRRWACRCRCCCRRRLAAVWPA